MDVGLKKNKTFFRQNSQPIFLALYLLIITHYKLLLLFRKLVLLLKKEI